MINNNKKIVVGMSEGIDSSVSLLLLKKQGFDPVGLSLKYAVWKNKRNLLRENVCCSPKSFRIAKEICQKLNIPHFIVDVSEEFEKKVINYFISELKNNKTPNPCVICNRYLKFKKLFEWAKEHNIRYVATGHYARIRKNPKTKKYELLRAKDKNKDQTYSLNFLPQKWLKNIIFPVGDYLKEEIYRIALREGFDFFLKRKQSQDFCFVAGKSLLYFLEAKIGKKPGLIMDTEDNILGKHKGLHFYTIGQRKGIRLTGGPYFVVDFDISKNILKVSKDLDKLYKKEIFLSPYHFISGITPQNKILVMAKVRYRQSLSRAILSPIKKNRLKIVFDNSQKAPTPGQFCVFWKGDVCLGGGVINNH